MFREFSSASQQLMTVRGLLILKLDTLCSGEGRMWRKDFYSLDLYMQHVTEEITTSLEKELITLCQRIYIECGWTCVYCNPIGKIWVCSYAWEVQKKIMLKLLLENISCWFQQV